MLIQANTNQATPMEIMQDEHPGVMSDNAELVDMDKAENDRKIAEAKAIAETQAMEKAENDRKIAEAKAKAETKAMEKAEKENKKVAEAKAKAERQRQAKAEKQAQKALNKALHQGRSKKMKKHHQRFRNRSTLTEVVSLLHVIKDLIEDSVVTPRQPWSQIQPNP
jgi:membrane protein involved in colicin uptake